MKRTDLRITPGSGNVFLDLGFPPHEAAVMLLRCELAEALRQWMERESLTQTQAAERLGIAQPRISEIARNRVESPASTTSVRQRQLDLCSFLLSSRRRGRWAVGNAKRFPRGVGGCRVVDGGGSLPCPVRPPAGVVGVRGRRGSFPQARPAHDVLALSVRLLAASAR